MLTSGRGRLRSIVISIMPIRPFLPATAAFDTQEIRAMDDALESAWRVIQHAGLNFSKEVLAAKIIAAAKRGERNQQSLRDAALKELGLHR